MPVVLSQRTGLDWEAFAFATAIAVGDHPDMAEGSASSFESLVTALQPQEVSCKISWLQGEKTFHLLRSKWPVAVHKQLRLGRALPSSSGLCTNVCGRPAVVHFLALEQHTSLTSPSVWLLLLTAPTLKAATCLLYYDCSTMAT
jgi:hypothetical protein